MEMVMKLNVVRRKNSDVEIWTPNLAVSCELLKQNFFPVFCDVFFNVFARLVDGEWSEQKRDRHVK